MPQAPCTPLLCNDTLSWAAHPAGDSRVDTVCEGERCSDSAVSTRIGVNLTCSSAASPALMISFAFLMLSVGAKHVGASTRARTDGRRNSQLAAAKDLRYLRGRFRGRLLMPVSWHTCSLPYETARMRAGGMVVGIRARSNSHSAWVVVRPQQAICSLYLQVHLLFLPSLIRRPERMLYLWYHIEGGEPLFCSAAMWESQGAGCVVAEGGDSGVADMAISQWQDAYGIVGGS